MIRVRILRIALLATAVLLGTGAAPGGQAQGYLVQNLPAYMPPPPPTDVNEIELDIARVKAAQAMPISDRWLEANADARAYNAEDIIRRFDDASGEILDEQRRPLLTWLIRNTIADAANYAKKAKSANPHPRPYVEDASIVPCDKDYLKDQESYPSGHAMNGYVVSKLIAAVVPGRTQEILSRGVRYGDNRVICGVHHPTDIDAGRHLGIVYFEAVSANHDFQNDLLCAQQEEAFLGVHQTPLSALCAQERHRVVTATPAAL